MNNQIVISEDVIDEDALGDLLASMKAVLGAEGYLEKCFFITSEDPRLLAALHALLDGEDAAPAPQKEKTRVKARKPARTSTKKAPQARWSIVGGGSLISRE